MSDSLPVTLPPLIRKRPALSDVTNAAGSTPDDCEVIDLTGDDDVIQPPPAKVPRRESNAASADQVVKDEPNSEITPTNTVEDFFGNMVLPLASFGEDITQMPMPETNINYMMPYYHFAAGTAYNAPSYGVAPVTYPIVSNVQLGDNVQVKQEPMSSVPQLPLGDTLLGQTGNKPELDTKTTLTVNPTPPPVIGRDDVVSVGTLSTSAAYSQPNRAINAKALLEQTEESEPVFEAMKHLGVKNGKMPGLKVTLMDHQLVGVSWMLRQETKSMYKGGILADEMGLGKTVQTIATLIANRPKDDKLKATLIVVPTSLISVWRKAIETQLEEGLVSLYIYHGSNRTRKLNNLKRYDVIITTYHTLCAEFPKDGVKSGIFKMDFFRIVLDEAHYCKNRSSRASICCTELIAVNRWCLTGTPIHNSVDDLYSLFRFLRVPDYKDWSFFREVFGSRDRDPSYDILRKRVMSNVLLRRTKQSQINGKAILTLPSKTVTSLSLEFSSEEREFYNALEQRSETIFNRYMRKGAVMRNYGHILALLLSLRRACDHPHLAQKSIEFNESLAHDLGKTSKAFNFSNTSLNESLVTSQKDTSVLPNPNIDGKLMNVKEKNVSLNQEQSGTWLTRELSTLSDAPMLTREYSTLSDAPPLYEEGTPSDDVPLLTIKREYSMLPDVSDGFYTSETTSQGVLLSHEMSFLSDVKDELPYVDLQATALDNGKSLVEGGSENDHDVKTEQVAKEDVNAEVKETEATLDELLHEVGNVPSDGEWLSSTKINALMKEIRAAQEEDPGCKMIVFSQWLGMLDLIQTTLRHNGYRWCRYDGSLDVYQRSEVLDVFQEESDVLVLLVSLKCGGLGLSLTNANRVFMMDPWWNPAVEDQAVDRVHRIGQTKDVIVKNITVANTVEDRILILQENKRKIASDTLNNVTMDARVLTERDLIFLFTGRNR